MGKYPGILEFLAILKIFLDEINKLAMENICHGDEPANECDSQPVIIGQQFDDIVEVRRSNRVMVSHYELSRFVFDQGLLDFFKALCAFDSQLV